MALLINRNGGRRFDIDRRAIFFFTAALLCVALLWPCLPQFRWVGIMLSIVLGSLGVLSLLDAWSRSRQKV